MRKSDAETSHHGGYQGGTGMKFVIFGLVALLSACVSASEVQPIGNGRYMVTGRASGGLNAGKETTQATKEANDYCAKLGKHMVLQNLDKTGNAAVFGENVNLTFTCE
jgi:hypothetical protein